MPVAITGSVRVSFLFKTVTMSPYHLPTSIAVDARFPGYSGWAQITYGTYQINVAVPDSVFTQQ